MKYVFYVAIMLFGLQAFSAFSRTVTLDHKKIDLGKLEQRTGDLASVTLKIVRTVSTPKKVDLNMQFRRLEYICTEPAAQECWEYNWVHLYTNKKVKLFFNKAHKLQGDQKEVFELRFEQKHFRTHRIHIGFDVIESVAPYHKINEVGESGWRRQGVSFRAK